MTFDQFVESVRQTFDDSMDERYKRGYEQGHRDATAAPAIAQWQTEHQKTNVSSGGGNQYIPPHGFVFNALVPDVCAQCGRLRQWHEQASFVITREGL